MNNIGINQKQEEAERLKEYIMMEQEKLEEAKAELVKSKERFQATLNESEQHAKKLVNEVREKTNTKLQLMKRIEELNLKMNQKDNLIKKYDDDLVECREHKHFLDILAIQAGKKKFQHNTAGQKRPASKPPTAGDGKKASQQAADGTFMTGVNHGAAQSPTKKNQNANQIESGASDNHDHLREIQLSDPYEDDDYKIYFDKNSLLAHINFLEDDNLFKINLVQQEEINLDKLLRQKEKNIKHVEDQVTDINENIDGFLITRE